MYSVVACLLRLENDSSATSPEGEIFEETSNSKTSVKKGSFCMIFPKVCYGMAKLSPFLLPFRLSIF